MAETAADVGTLYGYDSELYATANANARDAMTLANKLVAKAMAGTRTSKPKPKSKPVHKPCRYGDACRYAAKAKYRGDWPELSRECIGAHVARHGWWCPGWGVDPHESHDLTTDHVVDGDPTLLQVLCRGCNTRKRHTHPGAHPHHEEEEEEEEAHHPHQVLPPPPPQPFFSLDPSFHGRLILSCPMGDPILLLKTLENITNLTGIDRLSFRIQNLDITVDDKKKSVNPSADIRVGVAAVGSLLSVKYREALAPGNRCRADHGKPEGAVLRGIAIALFVPRGFGSKECSRD
jgi:hypothetical protein